MITFNSNNISENVGGWYSKSGISRKGNWEFRNISKILYNSKPVWNLIGKNGYSYYLAKTQCLCKGYYYTDPTDWSDYSVSASLESSSQARLAGFSFDYYNIYDVLHYQETHSQKITSVEINLSTYSVADLPDKYLRFSLYIADKSGQTYSKSYYDLGKKWIRNIVPGSENYWHTSATLDFSDITELEEIICFRVDLYYIGT